MEVNSVVSAIRESTKSDQTETNIKQEFEDDNKVIIPPDFHDAINTVKQEVNDEWEREQEWGQDHLDYPIVQEVKFKQESQESSSYDPQEARVHERSSDESEEMQDIQTIYVEMKKARPTKSDAFNEIEKIRTSELNKIYNSISGRKDVAFKAVLRKAKKYYFTLIKGQQDFSKYLIGDSKNITLIYAACESLRDGTFFSDNYEQECREIDKKIKVESRGLNYSLKYLNYYIEDFWLLLPFYLMVLSFPTDLKKWIEEQQEVEETCEFIPEKLAQIPTLILKTLDKFSMKNLHSMLMIPQFDFLIKFYIEKQYSMEKGDDNEAVSEYLLKFNSFCI
ncbi:unnamed protein product [Moneuplotes crassus]|uniref:Uncharacterized protein n=1 Tax=Euplotes crassus TaxID=5936 RepID=A0AAD2D0A9_EUPCR|nr:unnamed protein product [Moneuplotes crassus]